MNPNELTSNEVAANTTRMHRHTKPANKILPGLLASGLMMLGIAGTFAADSKVPDKPSVTTTKWDLMDVGPFFSSGLLEKAPAKKPEAAAEPKKDKDGKEVKKPEPPLGRSLAYKGISIKLGGENEAAVCFDTERMRMAAGWTGDFLKLPVKRDGLEGVPEIKGQQIFATPMLPGWSYFGDFADPRPRYQMSEGQYGPLPKNWVKWRGLYLNGKQTVLSYTVAYNGVLELPALEKAGEFKMITRTIQLDSAFSPLSLALGGDGASGVVISPEGVAIVTSTNSTTQLFVGLAGAPSGTRFDTSRNLVDLVLPKGKDGYRFKVVYGTGAPGDATKFASAMRSLPAAKDLKPLTMGGPARWTTPVVTKGVLGKDDAAYTVDTITIPEENPWKSWIRCSGFDFFKDGRIAMCSVSGDVWVVSGVDAKLEKLSWKRYATGLFQPLGLKIVDDTVYVIGRDQITRLHDLNLDGEADYYENFNNDISITSHYHEFCLNLETDSKGNFYFIKGGNLGGAKIPHHGTLLKVSKDGSKLEIFSTGHRAPNGLSIGPKDQITSSDNEGNWVPTSRVNLEKKGGFYGHVHTAHITPAPTNYDVPVFWLPHQLDNSSGGQVWVTSDKWGPFKGQFLHTSYGKSSIFEAMSMAARERGAVIRFPLNFDTGVMRARFSKMDGQLYAAGLRVWQSSGAREGAFHRVRYTGKPVQMPTAIKVKKNGIALTFTTPLDPKTAGDDQNYAVDQWNYRWTSDYGSKMYSVLNPDKTLGDKAQSGFKGDAVEVKSVKLSADRKTVFLEIPKIEPVMQMRIRYNIDAADGNQLKQEVFNTINIVPKR